MMMYRAQPGASIFLMIRVIAEFPASLFFNLGIKGITESSITASYPRIWFWVGVLTLVLIWNALSAYGNERLMGEIQLKTNIRLLDQAMGVVQGQSLATLESPAYQTLFAAFQQKYQNITGIQRSLLSLSRSLFGTFGLLSVFVFLPWPATVFIVVSRLLVLTLNSKRTKFAWRLFTFETREGRRGTYFQQLALGARSPLAVKSYGLLEVFQRRWHELTDKILKEKLDHGRRQAGVSLMSELTSLVGFLVGIISLLTAKGGLTPAAIGALVAFVSAYWPFSRWIASFITELHWFQEEAPALAVVQQYLSLPAEDKEGTPLPKKPLTIEFKDVSFRYPDSDTDVLKGVSLSLREGEYVALVGLNGAGKSTLISLLTRMYPPTTGQILVNGIDLWKIKPTAWRDALAMMSQAVPSFSDTLREQIVYGDYDRPLRKAAFDQALETSRFEDIAAHFPKKMDTVGGRFSAMEEDKAVELSGGQAQLLAVARTLYRKARIYIFDEPTSAVDAEKEEQFFKRLPEEMDGKLALFVSHRFSVLRRAQRIIVMDEGKIIEDGSHEVLLAKEGRYAELFALQAKMYR